MTMRPGEQPRKSKDPTKWGNKHIKSLSRKHRRMARSMYAENLNARELAKRFKMSFTYVRDRVVASDVFRNFLDDLEEFEGAEQSILRRRLVDLGDKAVDVLEDDLKQKPESFQERNVRQRAAKTVLEKGGVGAEKKDGEGSVVQHVSLTQVNIKNLTLAEKHDLATRLMEQPVG